MRGLLQGLWRRWRKAFSVKSLDPFFHVSMCLCGPHAVLRIRVLYRGLAGLRARPRTSVSQINDNVTAHAQPQPRPLTARARTGGASPSGSRASGRAIGNGICQCGQVRDEVSLSESRVMYVPCGHFYESITSAVRYGTSTVRLYVHYGTTQVLYGSRYSRICCVNLY